MSFLEVERNISYAPKTLRVYYQGSEATAIVGKTVRSESPESI